MFRKGKTAVKGNPKKVKCRIETESKVEQEKAGLKIMLVAIYRMEGDFTFSRTERRHQWSDQRFS